MLVLQSVRSTVSTTFSGNIIDTTVISDNNTVISVYTVITNNYSNAKRNGPTHALRRRALRSAIYSVITDYSAISAYSTIINIITDTGVRTIIYNNIATNTRSFAPTHALRRAG